MCRRRRWLGLTLVVTTVMLLVVVTWAQPDAAFTASYFDDADDDLKFWIAAEGSPSLVLDPVTPSAWLMLLTAVVLLQHAPPRRLIRPSCRLRAPPLP